MTVSFNCSGYFCVGWTNGAISAAPTNAQKTFLCKKFFPTEFACWRMNEIFYLPNSIVIGTFINNPYSTDLIIGCPPNSVIGSPVCAFSLVISINGLYFCGTPNKK